MLSLDVVERVAACMLGRRRESFWDWWASGYGSFRRGRVRASSLRRGRERIWDGGRGLGMQQLLERRGMGKRLGWQRKMRRYFKGRKWEKERFQAVEENKKEGVEGGDFSVNGVCGGWLRRRSGDGARVVWSIRKLFTIRTRKPSLAVVGLFFFFFFFLLLFLYFCYYYYYYFLNILAAVDDSRS
ncbi:hypothetical protein ACH5RR_015875 [Cinchona calisaya]|uniref:Transmembrane protein n=1 Tax=Cinchona calisaya TaxID=153742 RepID=A0ABD2ZUF0_9GENT